MPFREVILNNFWWKVTALLLAVGAWFGLSPEKMQWELPTTARQFGTRDLVAHPVTISKRADDNREFRVRPSEVDITISSRNLDSLRDLDGQEIRATVNLTEYTNQATVPITVYVPEKEKRGLELVKLFPETVKVEVVKE